MKYTQLGRSGLAVSRICLGCMTYGTPKWRPWVLDEIDARPFYKKALELGINFFDTVSAPIVGATKLEHLESAVKSLELELSEEQVRALEEPYQPHAVRGH
jgi:aryl-alcohol dehydrogenase-like predicted oxidoreductase